MSDEQAEQLELFPDKRPRPRRPEPLRPGAPQPEQAVPNARLRLGVLVSGHGSNLEAILKAGEAGDLPAEVAVVISNHSGVRALDIARAHGVPYFAIPRAGHPSRLEQQREIARRLEEARTELVIMAGFDRVLETELCETYSGRIMNVHPSLLPAFGGGMHAIADALAYGVRVTGVTIHFVTENVDEGPIILQEPVAIRQDDTLADLAERIHAVEHRLFPGAIRLYAEGRLRVEGRKVVIEQ